MTVAVLSVPDARKLMITLKFARGFFFCADPNHATVAAVRVADIVAASVSNARLEREATEMAVGHTLRIRTRAETTEIFLHLTIEQTNWFFDHLEAP